MKSVAMLPRTIRWMACLPLLFSATGRTQPWQLIPQPKINYLSSIGVRSTDVNQILLSAEHDGEWSKVGPNNLDPLLWTFTGAGYLQVHGTRYLADPARAQNLYFLDLHGALYYFVLVNGAMSWGLMPLTWPFGGQDGFYALAIDPNSINAAGQRVLIGEFGRIKYSDVAMVTTRHLDCYAQRPTPDNDTTCWHSMYINNSPDPDPDPMHQFYVTDIQYAPGSSDVAWAATSEASGWDDVPNGTVLPGGIQPGRCLGVLRTSNAASTNLISPPNWEILTALPGPTGNANCVRAVAPISTTQVFAATKAGLWKGTYTPGTPPTTTWTQIVPTGVPSDQRISSLFYPTPVFPLTTLYVGLATGDTSLDGVYKGTTTDNGLNWNWVAIPFPQPRPKVNALGGALNYADTFYAAFSNGDVLKRELVNGQNTISTLQGQHAGYPMATIAITPNPLNDNTFYVGTVCQGGVYRTTNGGSTWDTMLKPPPGAFHSHFHYVMRIAQDPTTAAKTYVTEDAYVFTTADGGGSWNRTEPLCNTVSGPVPCQIHLHGLAVAPSAPSTLYVGSGHGNWPGGLIQDSPYGRIWKSTNAGASWVEFNGFPGPSSTCNNQTKGGCYSVYTIAVSPRDANRVFVGTFGHENNAGDPAWGTGIGVVRSTQGGLNWQLLNNGLCPDGSGPCPASSPPPAGSKSLYVGTVAMDNDPTAAPNVYIATLNGLYKMIETGDAWIDISPSICPNPADCRRFESIAVHGSLLYAGTSEPLLSGWNPSGEKPAKIFQSTDGGTTWTYWEMPTNPPPVPRAWADQYRVRDIKIGNSTPYAVIEGSGIYSAPFNTAARAAAQRRSR